MPDELPRWLANPVREGRLLTDRFVSLENFSDFEFLTENEVSRVSMAKLTRNGKYYAVKGVKKKWVFRSRAFDEVCRHMDLVLGVHHRFVANTFRVFDHHSFVYLVQDYCVGGSLDMLIEKGKVPFMPGTLAPEAACFYCAEVALALNYLHKTRGIIHRNVRPSSIGISWNGHVKLLGFGKAAQVLPSEPYLETTNKDAHGGMEITAPELLPPRVTEPLAHAVRLKRENDAKLARAASLVPLRTDESAATDTVESKDQSQSLQYHSYEVDWWALGIMLHRLLIGFYPFGDSDLLTDTDIAKNVIRQNKVSPPMSLALHARRYRNHNVHVLLDQLLTHDETKRGGFAEVQSSECFAGVDWENLHKIKAPHRPKLAGVEADTSRFAASRKAHKKQMQVGVYPEELQIRPSEAEVSYTYFSKACKDAMTEALRNHTLRSRRELEEQERMGGTIDPRSGPPKSAMLVKLERGFQNKLERREKQRAHQRMQDQLPTIQL